MLMYHGNKHRKVQWLIQLTGVVQLIVEVFIQSVSFNGGQLERTYRGTLVGTIGADSLRPDLARWPGDGDDDFTNISFRFCQLLGNS